MNKKLCLSLVLIFLFSQVFIVQGTNFHAVCVGISDYPGTGDDLPENCVNSAEDMRTNLISEQNWSSSNIEIITDSDATESNITTAIGDMPNSTGNSELFFISGHGSTSGAKTYSGTISPSELQSAFGNSFNQYCAFMDVCHSGVFVEQMSKGEISSACKKSEDTYASGPDDYTYFGCFVLEGIENSAADPSSGHVVSAKEIHDYASPRVRLYAQSHNSTVQTLYNGVGHIPAAYQETWTKAGLLRDMSSVAPKMVKVINPGDVSLQIGAAFSLERNYVNNTSGLAIIYFGEGNFDFTSSITLAPNDSNIVFQGEGSDKKILKFKNMKNSLYFQLAGINREWKNLDPNFNKGGSILHTLSDRFKNNSSGHCNHSVCFLFMSGIPP